SPSHAISIYGVFSIAQSGSARLVRARSGAALEWAQEARTLAMGACCGDDLGSDDGSALPARSRADGRAACGDTASSGPRQAAALDAFGRQQRPACKPV